MSKVKTDAIETRAGGTSVLTIGTATQTIKLPGGSPGADKVLKSDASGNATWGADSGGLFASYSILADEKTSGTAGGTFTAAAWRTRDLQTEVYDGIGITFSTNEFVLPAGNYLIQWSAPAYSVNTHTSRLYDVTGAAVIAQGSTEIATDLSAHYSNVVQSRSIGSVRVTPSGANNYKIEHACETTYTTEGFGHPGNYGTEVYTIVEVYKES